MVKKEQRYDILRHYVEKECRPKMLYTSLSKKDARRHPKIGRKVSPKHGTDYIDKMELSK